MNQHILNILKQSKNRFVSGQIIANELSMSRANIWKEIKKLRNAGYQIDSKPKHGYMLKSSPLDLNHKLIESLCLPIKPDLVQTFESVPSTNDKAKFLAIQDQQIQYAILAANTQTNGKGRFSRSYYSPPNTGIYMSILLRPSSDLVDAQFITLITAVAVHEVLVEELEIITEIKWLNDLYINNKKIGGILTEGQLSLESLRYDYLVVGIGINIAEPQDIPKEISTIFGYLTKDQNFDRNTIIAKIYNSIIAKIKSYPESKTKTLEYYKKYSYVLNRKFSIIGNTEILTAIDIDNRGGLIAMDSKKQRRVLNSGEISIIINSDED